MFTILWLLSSYSCLVDKREFVVKVGILSKAYSIPPYGCAIRPRMLMEDPYAKCGLKGNAIVTTLSANLKAWLCKPVITVIDMP